MLGGLGEVGWMEGLDEWMRFSWVLLLLLVRVVVGVDGLVVISKLKSMGAQGRPVSTIWVSEITCDASSKKSGVPIYQEFPTGCYPWKWGCPLVTFTHWMGLKLGLKLGLNTSLP